MSLTPEEEECIRLRRTLQGEPDVWQSALQTFRNNTRKISERKRDLVEGKVGRVMTWHPNIAIIRLQDKRMHDFLNEALGRDTIAEEIAGMKDHIKDSDQERILIQEVIKRIEFDFILRWEKAAFLWKVNLNADIDPTVTLLLATIDHMHSGKALSPAATENDQYRSLANYYEWAIDSQSKITSRELIESSRQDGQLSSEYIKRVRSFIRANMMKSAIDDCRRERDWRIRGVKTGELFESLGQQITQPFCDRGHEKGVALVHSKEGYTVSARYVSGRNLQRFGWFRDDQYQMYCRFEFDDKFGAGFKVGMNGKVLSLARLNRAELTNS